MANRLMIGISAQMQDIVSQNQTKRIGFVLTGNGKNGSEVGMIHPERRRENLKKIEEMDKRDVELLQPDWKTWCMNKKVDMVEVVRCKDCNNRGTSDCPIEELCNGWIPSDDWFCADGERKEGK